MTLHTTRFMVKKIVSYQTILLIYCLNLCSEYFFDVSSYIFNEIGCLSDPKAYIWRLDLPIGLLSKVRQIICCQIVNWVLIWCSSFSESSLDGRLMWLECYLISDHRLDVYLSKMDSISDQFLDLHLRIRWTSNLKNKTLIAITEMDLCLKSDEDPIYWQD